MRTPKTPVERTYFWSRMRYSPDPVLGHELVVGVLFIDPVRGDFVPTLFRDRTQFTAMLAAGGYPSISDRELLALCAASIFVAKSGCKGEYSDERLTIACHNASTQSRLSFTRPECVQLEGNDSQESIIESLLDSIQPNSRCNGHFHPI